MTNIAIRIENLSKQYRLGTVGTGTLHDDLNRWWHRVRGKEDPYLKIGETNDRAHRGSSEYVWALRDINLEVKQGEVLGIIGKNGAGKSTLLKILSKVTGPTTGRIMAKGRIASLLEVGTGFHPELTGRENIYLNGAILGMTKHEVSRKLDEIVDFAGVERYLDTPVKRYSSGMKVRLGFAVAAFLEEEILIVDEVLAVGDAEFQKKAIGKMQDISNNKGRTILYVSHNLTSIENLCEKVIVLKDGQLAFIGETSKGIEKYISEIKTGQNSFEIKSGYFHFPPKDHTNFKILKISNNKGEYTTNFLLGEEISFTLELEATTLNKEFGIGIYLKNQFGERVTGTTTFMSKNLTDFSYKTKLSSLKFHCKSLPIAPGRYYIDLVYAKKGVGRLDFIENAGQIEVFENDFFGTGERVNEKLGTFFLIGDWI